MSSIERAVESNGVGTITLNRPEQRNAFDDSMIAELMAAFADFGADTAVRVVVLRGMGSVFSAGADLDWMRRMAAYSREENLADALRLQALFAAIDECRKVTVAEVQGAAMGGAIGLISACDYAVAAEDCVFAFSEVRLGLAPATIAPFILRRTGGRARSWMVTGRKFSAEAALRAGLLDEVVPPDRLYNVAYESAAEFARAAPRAVAATKKLLRELPGIQSGAVAQHTAECIAELRVSPEGQEGLTAFLEKRAPRFDGLTG
ncbi:MAG: enoyl-CoA hydratase/isomerase family protein [Armatimonadetes bacterium]|nr:enoyl-CoA hydratase/isomerase family protein [Armatimonadota bacterium]MDE2205744.1 enoyl-CoA hydratase/isomerase family protein [Armatimonadota bacterium]